MTITIDISAEIEAELERKAAEKGCAVDSYVVGLIEQAVQVSAPAPSRKDLVELFAESPLHGLDLDFSRNKSTGRPIDL